MFVYSSCSKEPSKPIVVNTIKEVASDIRVPKQLLTELNKEIQTEFRNINPVYVYFPLTVEFNDHGQSVFKQSHFRVQFEKGGGELDLKNYLTGRGSFYMHFPTEQFKPEWQLLHLYYVSQSPVKSLGSDKYGLGCGRWIDLKDSFKNFQNDHFLKLNSTDNRHLHVLSGYYIFIFKDKNQILMSQVSITDSQFQNKLCQNIKVASND